MREGGWGTEKDTRKNKETLVLAVFFFFFICPDSKRFNFLMTLTAPGTSFHMRHWNRFQVSETQRTPTRTTLYLSHVCICSSLAVMNPVGKGRVPLIGWWQRHASWPPRILFASAGHRNVCHSRIPDSWHCWVEKGQGVKEKYLKELYQKKAQTT